MSSDTFASSLADHLEAKDQAHLDVTAWRASARAEQQPPAPGIRTTYLRGGRGSGKSWSAGHIFAEWLMENPGPGEWAVVSPTYSDGRSMAIESPESGLLAALGTNRPEIDARKSKTVLSWNRSLGELALRAGAVVYVTGADNGAVRLQGKNLRGVWADEIGLWDRWDTAWDESIRMATRIKGARIIATGTPKSARRSVKLIRRLIDDPAVDNRLLRTVENQANLSQAFLDDVTGHLTRRLALQELEGQLLDEAEDALWKLETLDSCRVEQHPTLDLVVVAVDPAVTANEGSDETGILVVGRGVDGRAYVLADLSCKAHPAEVARRCVAAYDDYGANWIVAETNNGGDYIGALINTVNPNVGYKTVRATRGKYLRAEPVAAVYERGRAHHVGRFDQLEEQMVTFEPGTDESPDRLDALVYGVTALKIEAEGMDWADVYTTSAADKAKADAGEKPPPNPWADVYGRKPSGGV